MKTIILSTLAVTTLAFAACNHQPAGHDAGHNDSSATAHHHDTAPAARDVTTVRPQFIDVAPTITTAFKGVVDGYLQLKNALAADDDAAAAKAGETMSAALAKIDASGFTAAQKKIYTDNEADLKEHAEHIGKNAGNITHQREHFTMMSDDMYALVKAFGGGQPLYYAHCPMYNQNKGAYWLSESAAIKNPYMGQQMAGCGAVKELIQ
ncbi:DUF3347 domain-containing protein [Chitinophaga qingshengii]|uniref:DUF3347 domain-containing protein n=1 Tax=Chitinophaga qingshengii TaxID=1569794 RepID=A0ABR7TFG9_9BACT|nr:DUF3347 domain-containing protein [Chitinophaga qingshengii]MBC9929086.1 DUF3347 domain-containing protein [Chitinophaga qingshengii]